MAATINFSRDYMTDPILVRKVQMSALVAGQSEDVAHGGPTGKNVSFVTHDVVTPPTSPCVFSLVHDKDNDSLTNDTTRIKFVAEAGGDLTGMVVDVMFHFKHFKTGGNS